MRDKDIRRAQQVAEIRLRQMQQWQSRQHSNNFMVKQHLYSFPEARRQAMTTYGLVPKEQVGTIREQHKRQIEALNKQHTLALRGALKGRCSRSLSHEIKQVNAATQTSSISMADASIQSKPMTHDVGTNANALNNESKPRLSLRVSHSFELPLIARRNTYCCASLFSRSTDERIAKATAAIEHLRRADLGLATLPSREDIHAYSSALCNTNLGMLLKQMPDASAALGTHKDMSDYDAVRIYIHQLCNEHKSSTKAAPPKACY